jgi:putative DNA primase/helicase
MQGDKDMIRFLQQWAGMGLCGTPLHQKLAYFHGAGGNGKNVFIDTIYAVVGDYGHIADISLLMASRNEKHSTGTWALRGRRTALMSEPDESATWDTAKVKSLTGDNNVSARGMRENFITFPRTWTTTVVGNNKPHLKHVDDALRRRIMLVPFEYSVPKEERDEELILKLVEEAAGILRWMINGYLDVRANKLAEPKTIVDATRDYLSSEDIIGSFVADEIAAKPGAVTRHVEVFERWRAYAAQAGAEPGTRQALADRMERAVPEGVEYRRRTQGMVWLDIELRSVDWSQMDVG